MHILENEQLRVRVSSAGAELMSIYSKSDNVEYLWQGDKTYWSRRAPVLFPFVGRLLEDKYCFDGREYSVGQHGFARDREFVLSAQSQDYIEFSLRSDDATRALYPFDFELLIGYRLRDKTVATEYTVLNTGNKPLLFSIGAHPGFNIPLCANEKIDDYVLRVSERETAGIHLLEGPYYSGEQQAFFEQSSEQRLNQEMFLNDALVFKGLQSETVALVNPATGKGVAVDCGGWPYVGVWMPPKGAPFVCIEPWYGLADNMRHNGQLEDKEGIMQLAPLGKFFDKFVIKPL